MNTRKTSRSTQKGHFAVSFGLALAINAAVGLALLHAPTQGQRYLTAMASGNGASLHLASSNCSKARV